MPLKVLELGPLTLISTADDMTVTIRPKVQLKLPPGIINTLNNVDLLKAITIGKLWVSRGIGCRLDLQILFNGKPLEETIRLRMLESVGYHVRDAHVGLESFHFTTFTDSRKLWPQLSFSTSLDFPAQDCTESVSNNLLLHLNHSTDTSNTNLYPRGWSLDDVSCKPPDSVLCAEFEILQMDLEFNSSNKVDQIMIEDVKESTKKLKSSADVISSDEMLLGPQTLRGPNAFRNLDQTIHGLSKLSTYIAELFVQPESDLSLSSSTALPPDFSRGSKNSFSVEATHILQSWVDSHLDRRYPSRKVKNDLAMRTSLTWSKFSLLLVLHWG